VKTVFGALFLGFMAGATLAILILQW